MPPVSFCLMWLLEHLVTHSTPVKFLPDVGTRCSLLTQTGTFLGLALKGTPHCVTGTPSVLSKPGWLVTQKHCEGWTVRRGRDAALWSLSFPICALVLPMQGSLGADS